MDWFLYDIDLRRERVKNIPENSYYDDSSLYTNIDHEEGAEACFKKLEGRKSKSIPSIVIKNLILVILKLNAFPFGDECYRQTTATAMGTSVAPNYVNLFMDNFE